MQPPQKNIFGIDAGFMIGVAQVLDLLQLGGKIGYPIAAALTVATSWIPFIGTFIGGATLSAAGIFDVGTSVPIAIIGFSTMSLWFTLKRESPFSGHFIEKKFMLTIISFLVSCTPILNVLPEMTIWTCVNIYFAQQQYKEKLMKYNKWTEGQTEEMYARRQEYRETLLSET